MRKAELSYGNQKQLSKGLKNQTWLTRKVEQQRFKLLTDFSKQLEDAKDDPTAKLTHRRYSQHLLEQPYVEDFRTVLWKSVQQVSPRHEKLV